MTVSIEVPTEQDVNKADTDYYKTVYLFSTLSDELKKNDIEHKIEHDILNCDDKKVNPDLTDKEAEKEYKKNKAINDAELKSRIIDPLQQPGQRRLDGGNNGMQAKKGQEKAEKIKRKE